MSILLIGSGLLALGGLGAGFALRRLRRVPGVPEAVATTAPEQPGSTCPVCLARGRGETENTSKNRA